MTDRLHLGVIGAGRIGRVHAANLALGIPRATPLVVADVDASAARTCAREVGIPEAVHEVRAVIENATVDAVVICSPTDTHLAIIEAAAEAGKHVFCEKPIASTLEEIDRALVATSRAGVKLQVGFNRRFDASYRRIREAVERGQIGEPHLLHLVSRDPAPPPLDYVARSGGIFFDMTVHDFDMARFLVGAEVEEVFTMAAVRVDPAIGEAGDVDTAVVVLRFENGVIGTIDNSRRAVYGYDQRAEVFGSGGSAASGNQYPNTVVLSTAEAVGRDLPLNFFMERYAESYRAEMAAFVDAVLDDAPVPVGGHDGRMSVVIGMAARRSYDEGRPVRLDEVAEIVPPVW
jgi:myo-inositol 2-dehydrogenase / D-chiro-inositol 1-dehydrogenase